MNSAWRADDDRASVDTLVVAARSQQPADIRNVLRAVADVVGPARCIDSVLMPAVRRLARSGGTDASSAPDVALLVEAARAWVDSLAASAPPPELGRPIVLACGPGDRHSLGLEALTMLMRRRRQPCRLLGARASSSRVSIAVEVNRPAGVVLIAEQESGRRSCVELLRALEGIGTTTFYAGAAFEPAAMRRDVPGTYLGTSFERASAMIARILADELAAAPSWTE